MKTKRLRMRREVTEPRLARGSFGSVPSASPPRPRVAWDGAALMAVVSECVRVHGSLLGETSTWGWRRSTARMRSSREHTRCMMIRVTSEELTRPCGLYSTIDNRIKPFTLCSSTLPAISPRDAVLGVASLPPPIKPLQYLEVAGFHSLLDD